MSTAVEPKRPAPAPSRRQIQPRIESPLARLGRTIRTYVFLEGVISAVILAGLWFWSTLVLDFGIYHLSGWDYLAATGFDDSVPVLGWIFLGVYWAVLGGGLLYLIGYKVLYRLVAVFNERALALVLERRFPKDLGDRLVTAVELNDPGLSARYGFSQVMLEQTAQQAAERVEKLPLRLVFNWGRLGKQSLFALLLIVSIAAFVVLLTPTAAVWADRNLLFEGTGWPPRVMLEVIDFKAGETSVTQGSTQRVRMHVWKWVVATKESRVGWRQLRWSDLGLGTSKFSQRTPHAWEIADPCFEESLFDALPDNWKWRMVEKLKRTGDTLEAVREPEEITLDHVEMRARAAKKALDNPRDASTAATTYLNELGIEFLERLRERVKLAEDRGQSQLDPRTRGLLPAEWQTLPLDKLKEYIAAQRRLSGKEINRLRALLSGRQLVPVDGAQFYLASLGAPLPIISLYVVQRASDLQLPVQTLSPSEIAQLPRDWHALPARQLEERLDEFVGKTPDRLARPLVDALLTLFDRTLPDRADQSHIGRRQQFRYLGTPKEVSLKFREEFEDNETDRDRKLEEGSVQAQLLTDTDEVVYDFKNIQRRTVFRAEAAIGPPAPWLVLVIGLGFAVVVGLAVGAISEKIGLGIAIGLGVGVAVLNMGGGVALSRFLELDSGATLAVAAAAGLLFIILSGVVGLLSATTFGIVLAIGMDVGTVVGGASEFLANRNKHVTSPWYTIKVSSRPPALRTMERYHLEPGYLHNSNTPVRTGPFPISLEGNEDPKFDVPMGARLELRVRAHSPLDWVSVKLQSKSEFNAPAKLAAYSLTAPLTPPGAIRIGPDVVSGWTGVNFVEEQNPYLEEGSQGIQQPRGGESFTLRFKPLESEDLRLRIEFTDKDGLRGEKRITVLPRRDESPKFSPPPMLDAIRREMISPRAYIPFSGRVSDDHGLSALFYEVQVVKLMKQASGVETDTVVLTRRFPMRRFKPIVMCPPPDFDFKDNLARFQRFDQVTVGRVLAGATEDKNSPWQGPGDGTRFGGLTLISQVPLAGGLGIAGLVAPPHELPREYAFQFEYRLGGDVINPQKDEYFDSLPLAFGSDSFAAEVARLGTPYKLRITLVARDNADYRDFKAGGSLNPAWVIRHAEPLPRAAFPGLSDGQFNQHNRVARWLQEWQLTASGLGHLAAGGPAGIFQPPNLDLPPLRGQENRSPETFVLEVVDEGVLNSRSLEEEEKIEEKFEALIKQLKDRVLRPLEELPRTDPAAVRAKTADIDKALRETRDTIDREVAREFRRIYRELWLNRFEYEKDDSERRVIQMDDLICTPLERVLFKGTLKDHLFSQVDDRVQEILKQIDAKGAKQVDANLLTDTAYKADDLVRKLNDIHSKMRKLISIAQAIQKFRDIINLFEEGVMKKTLQRYEWEVKRQLGEVP